MRHSRNGAVTLRCPTMILSVGNSSNRPLTTRRQVWVKVSMVNPSGAPANTRTVLEIGPHHRWMRWRRVDIERHVERRGAREDRAELLVVHEAAVGQPHDHGALEIEFCDGAFQFVGRGFRVGRRQGGEARRNRVGVCAHRFVQRVVGSARQCDGAFGVELLGGGVVFGNDLEVDARLVHLAQAQRAEIVQSAL